MTPADASQSLRDTDTHGQAAQLRPSNHGLIVCEPQDARRPQVEAFIRTVFAKRHGATVKSFLPTLLALHDGQHLCSAAGVRPAGREPLFLERYLDQPIEQALSNALYSARPQLLHQQAVVREEIVEVGNLAGVNCRAACRLVLALPQLLLGCGYRWITFTATDTVRELLETYQAPLIELAPAVALRVSGLGDDWGRYYDTDPRVMAGYLPDGLGLKRRTHPRA